MCIDMPDNADIGVYLFQILQTSDKKQVLPPSWNERDNKKNFYHPEFMIYIVLLLLISKIKMKETIMKESIDHKVI